MCDIWMMRHIAASANMQDMSIPFQAAHSAESSILTVKYYDNFVAIMFSWHESGVRGY